MDWIERVFHTSPDGGSGAMELGVIIGVVVAAAMALAGTMKLIPAVSRVSRGLLRQTRRTAKPAPNRVDR
jgi:hypothetical protein